MSNVPSKLHTLVGVQLPSDCHTEEISACTESTRLNFIKLSSFSPLVNTIIVSLYCGNCAQINAKLAPFNVTY